MGFHARCRSEIKGQPGVRCDLEFTDGDEWTRHRKQVHKVRVNHGETGPAAWRRPETTEAILKRVAGHAPSTIPGDDVTLVECVPAEPLEVLAGARAA